MEPSMFSSGKNVAVLLTLSIWVSSGSGARHWFWLSESDKPGKLICDIDGLLGKYFYAESGTTKVLEWSIMLAGWKSDKVVGKILVGHV